MNEEDPPINEKIASIKNEKMRDYLFMCLTYEYELNSNLPSSVGETTELIKKATQRFENKIKACEQIENDLPNLLISAGDYLLLKGRLDTLKFKLASLYVDTSGEITDHNYNEIKFFIYKILNLKDIKLKLKYFDLTIKLLEKAETSKAESHFNKEFIGALDLLKKFVTEKKYIPNEADLKYISDLDHGSNESDIRKSFYGIIHELDKKLLFQDLLKQLLEIIENKNNSPLIQFSIIFIKKCLGDAQMDAGDLHQAIHIMHSALIEYNKQVKSNAIFNRVVRNKLIDLEKFEKALQEKISLSITDNLVNPNSQKQESEQVPLSLKEPDFAFFTTNVNNKKIKLKLHEAKVDYNQKFIKKITTDNSSSKLFSEGLKKIKTGKDIIVGTVVNLEKFAETSKNRLTSLVKKNPVTSSSQEHEKTDQIDLNNSLTQAKEKLSSIKEQLTRWDSILNDLVKQDINQHNQIDTGQIKKTEDIDAFEASINEKYRSLSLQIPQILDEFEKINTKIKEKDYWLAESEINKISLAYKIFYRGYFNIDFSIKKLKAELGDAPSFDEINNFISKQSFCSLLFTYGIVRWPWLKNNLALTWAEQLCLPDVITQIKELKENLSINNNEDLVKKIIVLLNAFPSYKKSQAVVDLNEFKKYIVTQLNQLERLELKNESLNEKINLAETPGNRNQASFFAVPDLSRSATSVSNQSAQILVN